MTRIITKTDQPTLTYLFNDNSYFIIYGERVMRYANYTACKSFNDQMLRFIHPETRH